MSNRNNTGLCKRFVNGLCMVTLLLGVGTQPAFAAIISTEMAQAIENRQAVVDRIQTRLAQNNVAAAMARLGADPAAVGARVALLSDAELMQLDSELDSLPAGAGAIEIIGVVFLVLLILEVVGVTDIFKKV